MIKDKMGNGPDPSSLTTAQLLREVESLKELLMSKITGIEKAVEVSHEDLVRVPTKVQEAVGNLKDLTFQKIDSNSKLVDEKFSGVYKQLELIESTRLEQKKDIALAVDAAFKAAKEAVSELNNSNVTAINKSEASTAKQIEAFDGKISDIKERLGTDQGKNQGISLAWGVFLALIGVVGIVFGIVMAVTK